MVTLLEAREEAFNYAKEKFAVGMMNTFDFNQVTIYYVTSAQSDALSAKYDYIFKIKIVEFYFGIPLTKKNKKMSKKIIYLSNCSNCWIS